MAATRQPPRILDPVRQAGGREFPGENGKRLRRWLVALAGDEAQDFLAHVFETRIDTIVEHGLFPRWRLPAMVGRKPVEECGQCNEDTSQGG